MSRKTRKIPSISMKLYIRGSDTRKVIYIFVTTIKIEIGVREYRSSLLIRSYNYPVLLWNLKISIARRISFECDFLNLFQPPKLTREFKRKNFQSTRYSDFEMRTLKTSISHPRSDCHIYSPDEDQLSSNIDWNFLLREYIFLIRVQREREERWMRIRGVFPTLENVSVSRSRVAKTFRTRAIRRESSSPRWMRLLAAESHRS